MLSAVLFLVLTLAVFAAATVVAVTVMLFVGARRGGRTTTPVDTATVSLIRRRARRLGLRDDTPPGGRKPAS